MMEHQKDNKTGTVLSGKVKWYDPQKGFGFILKADGTDVFFHHTALPGEEFKKSVFEGDDVKYVEHQKPDGNLFTTKILEVHRST